ncbi:hypothetical protein FISHEDRAFT_73732 [Fistulina hepatica ATCC 64428]|uniref:Uncharacterized protein n=1 Tax=Fistulina hepatica ATCC 64428 TaxID=1128425 RepID=A0A0D7ABF2_9AGAR|nr:hypothetical protein FISHEDRAFT_73732 [Fistulina hepatica ATCC 64428]
MDLPKEGYEEDGYEESFAESRPASPAEKTVQLERTDHRAIDLPQRYAPLDHIAVDEVLGLLNKPVGCTIAEKSGSFDDILPMLVIPILLTPDKINVIWRPLSYYYVTIYAINV